MTSLFGAVARLSVLSTGGLLVRVQPGELQHQRPKGHFQRTGSMRRS